MVVILKTAGIVLPLVGALVIWRLPPKSRAGYWVTIATMSATALVCLSLMLLFPLPQVFEDPQGFSPFALGILILLMFAVAVILQQSMLSGPPRPPRFYGLMLLMASGLTMLTLGSGFLIFAGGALFFGTVYKLFAYGDIIQDIREDKSQRDDHIGF